MHKRHLLRALERFAADHGAPVSRRRLARHVAGSSERNQIVLRRGLSVDEQLLTLVHELTHLLAHQSADPPLNRTVCEYEAEAVERLVCSRLRIVCRGAPRCEAAASPTDDLLEPSVRRVLDVTGLIVASAATVADRRPDRCNDR